ncbi:hypothetical protein B0H67DRAFT_597830 [Lasiosphaeris hirsuta]|uniref:Heterokaryon incompatibility domain-containing protein n=1 Tax=Lasiosphaeris hirsuta TaxID=260670 RepID=A0AA40EEC1_9PEZI|nr:hypothetical protein B0H67DRAFT_597830 [Lasiosphaeris hirsuta]
MLFLPPLPAWLKFNTLPKEHYAIISYVWRGVPPRKGMNVGPTFSIKDASNADPIPLETLHTVCVAALQRECASGHCAVCFILPRGLSRLVKLDEETPWLGRAWTLQEALAPNYCKVLFAWKHGSCVLQRMGCAAAAAVPVVAGRAAVADLKSLLEMGEDIGDENEANHLTCVFILLSYRLASLFRNHVVSDLGQKYAASISFSNGTLSNKGMAAAVWRAAMLPTPYQPVDMVLSIIGILGIELDPAPFSTSDRSPDMIALMPSVQLPTIDWWLKDAPRGPVDDNNCMVILAPAVALSSVPVGSKQIYLGGSLRTLVGIRSVVLMLVGGKRMGLCPS